MAFSEVLAASFEHAQDGYGADHAAGGADLALEQERHRRAPDLVVRVEAPQERDGVSVAGVPSDDGGDDVEQLGGHRDDALTIGLGRADDQEGDHLAVVALVVTDAEVTDLAHLLDADARMAQG